MEERQRLIALAKAYIDNGMCRVGPRMDRKSKANALLAGHASRSVVLGDAISQLCVADRPNEALPLLRELMEIVAAMTWVSSGGDDAEGRAAESLSDLKSSRWAGLWDDDRAQSRLKEAGIPSSEVDSVLSLCQDFRGSGRAIVPWCHVFEENQSPGTQSDKVMRLAVRMMVHVLKALDSRWPDCFPGSEALWE